MTAVYAELKRLARRFMAGEQSNQTLQPTALVNEAYLRLMNGPESIADRNHFFALAAQAMRRVLIDCARQRRAARRGSGAVHLNIDDQPVSSEAKSTVEVMVLDSALESLAKLDPQAAQVVELRFFGGYTDREVCSILGENFAAVRRHWEFGRAWLKHNLDSE